PAEAVRPEQPLELERRPGAAPVLAVHKPRAYQGVGDLGGAVVVAQVVDTGVDGQLGPVAAQGAEGGAGRGQLVHVSLVGGVVTGQTGPDEIEGARRARDVDGADVV